MNTNKILFAVLSFSLAATTALAQNTVQNQQKVEKIDQALTAAMEHYPQDSAVAYVNIALLRNEVEDTLQANARVPYETLYKKLNPVISHYLFYRLQKTPLSEEETNTLMQAFDKVSQQNQSIIRMIINSANIRAVTAQETYEKMQAYIERQKQLPYFSDLKASENMFPDWMIELLGPERMSNLLKQLFAQRLAERPFSETESKVIAFKMNLSDQNTRLMESLLRGLY